MSGWRDFPEVTHVVGRAEIDTAIATSLSAGRRSTTANDCLMSTPPGMIPLSARRSARSVSSGRIPSGASAPGALASIAPRRPSLVACTTDSVNGPQR